MAKLQYMCISMGSCCKSGLGLTLHADDLLVFIFVLICATLRPLYVYLPVAVLLKALSKSASFVTMFRCSATTDIAPYLLGGDDGVPASAMKSWGRCMARTLFSKEN